MNLAYLFEIQAGLDAHIMDEHPELKDQDNLDWKILALQVELGECANEWRGFKKWSNDQGPRVFVPNPDDICENCKGEAYFNKEKDMREWVICNKCDGCGVHFHNPLLEEYVDCLHFILSIGLEKGFQKLVYNESAIEGMKRKDITSQFNYLFDKIGDFSSIRNHNNYMYIVPLFIGLGEMLGFTWEQIEQAYLEKNKVNHERQNNGY